MEPLRPQASEANAESARPPRAPVEFFRAVADRDRLRILGLLAGSNHSVRELAAETGLRPVSVSHHLAALAAVGLVNGPAADGYSFSEGGLSEWAREVIPATRRSGVAEAMEGEEWERKVLQDYLDGDDRLKLIPAQHRKRMVILRWLADHFMPGVGYPEKQVNEILSRYHQDRASLRRSLVDEDLMQRDRGTYWRAGTLPAAQ